MTGGLRLYPAADEAPAVWVEDSPGERLVQALLEDLRLERPGRAPQHHLVLGPPGAGKSAALARLKAAVLADPQLAGAWVPVTLSGPHMGLASAADLWRAARRGLSGGRALDGRGQGSREALSEALRAAPGRRLLLLIDEVDRVFERLTAAGEEWALRESVSHGRDVLLVAASARPLEATYEYGRAFYDFFRVRELETLGERESVTFARAVAGRGTRVSPARVAALRLLCGGAPRLVARAAFTGGGPRVADDLGRLLDAVTPDVRSTLGRLPAQGQRVVAALGRGWAPRTARQVAEEAGLGVNAASAQLSRLGQQGVVQQVVLPHTKRRGFLLADRLVNLWLLWRWGGAGRERLERLVQQAEMVCGPAGGGVEPGASAQDPARALRRAMASRARDPWAAVVWAAAVPPLRALVAAGRGGEAAALVRASPRAAAWEAVAEAVDLADAEGGEGASAREGGRAGAALAAAPPEWAAVVRRAGRSLTSSTSPAGAAS